MLNLCTCLIPAKDPESDMHRDVKEDLWSLMFQVLSLTLLLAVGEIGLFVSLKYPARLLAILEEILMRGCIWMTHINLFK